MIKCLWWNVVPLYKRPMLYANQLNSVRLFGLLLIYFYVFLYYNFNKCCNESLIWRYFSRLFIEKCIVIFIYCYSFLFGKKLEHIFRNGDRSKQTLSFIWQQLLYLSRYPWYLLHLTLETNPLPDVRGSSFDVLQRV